MEGRLALLLISLCFATSSLCYSAAAVTVPQLHRWLPHQSPVANPIRPSEPPSTPSGNAVSPTSFSFVRKRHSKSVATPPGGSFEGTPSMSQSPAQANHAHKQIRPASIALPPTVPRGPEFEWVTSPVQSPSVAFHKHHHHHKRNRFRAHAPVPAYSAFPPVGSQKGVSVSPFKSPSPSTMSSWSPEPAPSPTATSSTINSPSLSPTISPASTTMWKKHNSPPSSSFMLPPPPPNEDCGSLTCSEPLTYTPAGSTCACVWPIQVKIRLGVAIYTFFPLVSEMAEEIAGSVGLNRSQVRIMGADTAHEQQEETVVLVNLVPREVKFNETTAFAIYKKFWDRKVSIKASLFGAYQVLYVHYPGLPPSPPSASSGFSPIDDGPNPGSDIAGSLIKPMGVDVPGRKKEGLGGNIIIVIILSSITALVVFVGIAWLLLLKCGVPAHQQEQVQQLIASSAKPPGTATMTRSEPGSSTMSFGSGCVTYTGSARNFTLKDIERATNNFDPSRILGEGGFGLVYSGVVDSGREVAVKVLKRDDEHGSREFLAEVEMLSRLHHRNLVKLIGICTEDQTRCLVYELVPNGSVESHLHGIDRETDPLDWDARMRIALGAARGLAYLHEDSNPRVIHRDFKSSNILLEYDFTPKISDFGLARTALEEGNKHISTHVMGTFGYLAPEYAMTGHLLVKSDVYSYGVVLLELLTGRKPVDLSMPPGQENLVAWARPLLTSEEGLETIIDPAIRSDITFDSAAKVAAIASMCVQPEVSHRPFMGEVVQALKLVCNEFDETKELGSRSCSQEEFLPNVDDEFQRISGEIVDVSEPSHQVPRSHETRITFSTSEFLSAPVGLEGQEFESFRMHSASGPLRTGRRRHFWQRLRSLSRGSMSEHGYSSRFWVGLH